MKELRDFQKERVSLKELAEESLKEKIPVITNEVGRLLETMVFLIQPKNILEIGCGEGYSTYYIVKNLENGAYCGIDLNRKRLERAKRFISNGFPDKKISFIHGNALKLIPDLSENFDFIFIDAAKYEYLSYLDILLEKLVHEAVIIADNVFFSEKIFSNYVKEHDKNSVKGLKEFIKFIKNTNLFKTIFLDISDGVSVSIFKKNK